MGAQEPARDRPLVVAVGETFETFYAREYPRDQNNGLPAFDPRPLTGATALHSELGPGVRLDLPRTRSVQDTAGILSVKFSDKAEAGLLAMRVASCAESASPSNLVGDLRKDSRVHVVSASQSTVGGQPATRFLVTQAPGITTGPWFCPVGGRPCLDFNATGGSTVYLFRHDGEPYVLVGGALNCDVTAAMRPIVDGAAATWQW